MSTERATLRTVGAVFDALTAHALAVAEIHRQVAEDAHAAKVEAQTDPYDAAHERPATPRSNTP